MTTWLEIVDNRFLKFICCEKVIKWLVSKQNGSFFQVSFHSCDLVKFRFSKKATEVRKKLPFGPATFFQFKSETINPSQL